MDIFLELLSVLPALSSLTVTNLAFWRIDQLSTRSIATHSQILQLHIRVRCIPELKTIRFLADLCPCLKYFHLELQRSVDLLLIVECILRPAFDRLANRCSLCVSIPAAYADSCFQNMHRRIEKGQAVRNYTYQRLNNRIYLLWA